MKRTATLSTLVIALSLCAAGCGGGAGEDRSPSGESTGGPSAAPSLTATPPAALTPSPAPPPPAAARSEKVSNALYEFEYAYPAAAGAIPGLKALLDQRLEATREELEKQSRSDRAAAQKDGFPYRAHSSGATWRVVTDLPRWLSLSADMYEYTGGAHGMTFFDALLWDRQANAQRVPTDLFSSKAALSRVIREPFCAALDKEREKRRGQPVKRDSGDSFDECVDPVESTIILGSSNGRTFDRIGVLVGPYAAGSYAEGIFDITLPVTRAVLAAVKPEYRGEFSSR